jgi:membrane-associated protease RseP (regulator of RpoE activity)
MKLRLIPLLLAGSLLPILPGSAQDNLEEPAEIPYLGVATVPAPPPVTAQLKLSPGFGLLVVDVIKESPAAAAGLQPNDVLVKFEDQHLIEPNQLAVLVRARKPEDQITLTLIRAGETKTQPVKIGRRPPPKNARSERPAPRSMIIRPDGPPLVPALPAGEPGRERNVSLRRSFGPDEPVPFSGQIATMIVDGGKHYQLLSEPGGDVLIVSDPEKRQLFRGPVSSPEDRGKVPEEFRGILKKMEDIRENLPPLPPAHGHGVPQGGPGVS